MSNHSVSAMTGLKAPKRRGKRGAAKVVDAKVSDLATALDAGQAVLDATVRLANALRVSGTPRPIAVKVPAKASPAAKVSHPVSRPAKSASRGAVTGKGWTPAKITDGPDIFQGTGDTVDD